jgi:DNA polymerase I-like protein with 3'-5' exonuclease and polymerase domains
MDENLLNLVPCDWRPYKKFPDLSEAKQIAVDVETYDPNLSANGPGALRKDGYIIGFSVATDDGFMGYYPIRHDGGDNLENPDGAVRWLKDQMNYSMPKVGANILYDLIWMKCDLGIEVRGKKYDVQIAEPLLDENRAHYTLDSLSEDYLGENKIEDKLYKAGSLLLGIKGKGDTSETIEKSIIKQVKGRLWELPARYVGEYGEADAILPIRIFEKQIKRLKEVKLWDLFDNIETPLIDVLLKMWIKGIPVNVEKGEEIRNELSLQFDKTMRSIKRRVGFIPDIWSADDVVKGCDKLGLDYIRTNKGNPSFTADWLKTQEHPYFQSLLHARQLDRSGSVFIQGKILDLEVNGRIHPQFWQVKNEKYGTGSGRFSSSNPNAQQFPARNEVLARLVRSILCAEKGKEWGKFDYSQQEFRITVHYASLLNLTGAQEAMQKYIKNPDTDFHQMVSDMTSLARKIAKSLNLGLSYGMGVKKFSEMYGIPYGDARKYYNLYHKGLPFIKELTQRSERTAKFRKYVRTILGRHCHFDLYGPTKWEKGIIPKKYDAAIKEFGNPIVLYFTYRAMNKIVQGSAADMIKKAMLDCADAGYIPSITVHDELDFCDIESPKQIEEIHDIMVNAILLKVPNKVDIEIGPNWGECEEVF